MHRYLMLFVAAVALGLSEARAAVPPEVNHQGRLVDPAGQPVTGPVDLTFQMYTNETGGLPLWEQTVTNVPVRQGIYDARFGDAALTNVLTNTFCWLEVRLDGAAIGPRHRLLSVPYALRTEYAERLDPEFSGMPSGVVILWSGLLADIPDGWTLCDGTAGTPDLTEKFVMGAATTPEVGTVVGTNGYAMTQSQMPAHTHTASSSTDGNHTHTASSSTAGNHSHSGSTSGAGSHGHTISKKRSYGYNSGAASGNYPPAMTATSDQWTSTTGNHSHSISVNSAGNHSHTITVNAGGSHTHTLTLGSTGSGATIDNRPAFFALAYIMKL